MNALRLTIGLLLLSTGFFSARGEHPSRGDSLLHAISLSKNDSVRAWRTLLLARQLEQEGNDSALFWYEKALRAAKACKEEPASSDLQGNTHMNIAVFLLRSQGNSKEVQSHLNHAKELFERSGNKPRLADVFTTLGICEYYEHNHQKAIGFHLESLKLIESDDTARLAKAYNNLGLSYSEANELEKATDAFQKAIRLNEATNDIYANGWLYSNIGAIYSKLEYYQKAREYFQKSLRIMEQYGNEFEVAGIQNNLGSAYRELNQLDSAAALFEKARETSARLGRLELQIHATNNLGIIYSDKKQFDKAHNLLEEALNMSRDHGSIPQVIMTLGNFAMLMNQAGNYSQAIAYSGEALALCDSIDTERPKIELYENLSNAYTALNNADLALKYFSLKISLQDSLNSNEQKEALYKLESEFAALKHQSEIERQKNELLQREAKEEIQQAEIIALIAGLGLTCLIILFLFREYRIKSVRNKDLQAKNQLILEQKDQIEIQRGELEKLNQNKDKLFSILSHDLRGPFGSLRMLLNMMGSHHLSAGEINNMLIDLSDLTNKNYGFIENLLQWSRSQLEGLTPQETRFSLGELVEETAGLFKYPAQRKEITLTCNVDKNILLHSDPDLVQLIIRNLLTNAIKYSNRGGTVKVDGDVAEDWVRVSVTDQGIGIPPEKLANLFAFTGYSKRGTENEAGTGLGLTLCKEVVQLLGGEIWVESLQGKGSTFSFRIPAKGIIRRSSQETAVSATSNRATGGF